MKMTTWEIRQGDALDRLREMSDGIVQCCITSPPYFGLRDYGADGQLGLEATPDEFVARLVEVFRGVCRVLRDDGTLWLNIGDSYCSTAPGTKNAPMTKGSATQPEQWANERVRTPPGMKPKDLMGIPWMLACALRQPWERRVIKDPTDRAWLAGLVDGEGCISVVAVQPTTGVNESHSMRLQIRMADTEAVERVVAITGLSNVSYDQTTGPGCRPAQQWKISGDKAADVLADIYPYLTVKRKQAVVGWNLQRLKDGVVTKRGQPIPSENMAKRRLLHDALRSLNQREPVDLPSWCREPEIQTEPGWYLRSDVIWSKPNSMPERVTDRPTSAHEHVFLLAKNARYFYDADAIREPGRNKRNVWEVATQPFSGWNLVDARIDHFALFPPKLIEPCVLAGSAPGDLILDPFAGSGTAGVVALRHDRSFVGIELNAEYVQLARRRICDDAPLLNTPLEAAADV